MRTHLSPRYIQDSTGNLITTASVRVYDPGTTTPITDTMYSGDTGGATKSQGFVPADGMISFYLNRARRVDLGITKVGGSEEITPGVDVGAVLTDWINVKQHFGARGDGSTDDSVQLQNALNEMNSVDPTTTALYFPPGEYMTSQMLVTPEMDGATLLAPPGGTNRNPPATIKAMGSVGALPAIMATPEWANNGLAGGAKDGQGLTIVGLGFDGGGFTAGSVHDGVIETTSKAVYGLVIHGSGFKLIDVFVVSTNSHGVLVPGVGSNGSYVMSESHENLIFDLCQRYSGGDGLHIGPGQQDSWMSMSKLQYCGGHNIYSDTSGAGWSFIHNHPSLAAKDLIHCESGWNYRIADNYLGSVGEYMDNTGYAGGPSGHENTHFAIYINGKLWNVHDNSTNTNTAGGQLDPVANIFVDGKGNCHHNTMLSQAAHPPIPADNIDATALANNGIVDITSAGSNVHFNILDSV